MFASIRRLALLVDGSKPLPEVLGQFESSSNSFSAALDVLAVGQKGTLIALELLARRPQGKIPWAVVDKVGEEAVLSVARSTKPDFKVKGRDLTGRDTHGDHNYRLSFPQKDEWLDASAEGTWEGAEKLIVASQTKVMPLAKAVAARMKALPENGVLLLETALRGDQDSKRLRVSHLARAISRVYAWQERPVNPSFPVRPFRCAARILDGKGVPNAPLLQLAVLPRGLPVAEPSTGE
eukprot:symbB.v1.2.024165.t1/scaffold2264.1/size174359/20